MIEPVIVFLTLILARVGAFVAMLNILGAGSMPRMVKVGLTGALTLFWATTLWGQMAGCLWLCSDSAGAWLGYTLAVGKEVMLGAVVGFTFELFLLPARVAGEFLAQEMGLTFGNLASATGGSSVSPLTVVFELVASAVFLSLDGHHAFFGMMHGMFEQYPVAGVLPSLSIEGVLTNTTEAQEWGLMLAAPVALCLFLTTVVLNLLGRATPQLNLYTVGFPLRMGVGLVALFLLLPQVLASLLRVFQNGTQWFGRIF